MKLGYSFTCASCNNAHHFSEVSFFRVFYDFSLIAQIWEWEAHLPYPSFLYKKMRLNLAFVKIELSRRHTILGAQQQDDNDDGECVDFMANP